mmetsp:Transcript_23699/g.20585  ORF Transcript_23699/g.20585 Transcript_23699/m.20585 type:complete len:131 (-) Transcript_23699:1848-2240(-)
MDTVNIPEKKLDELEIYWNKHPFFSDFKARKKNLRKDIDEQSKELLKITNAYNKVLTHLNANKDNKTKSMLAVDLYTCIVAIPRNSKSYDNFVLSADYVGINIDLKQGEVDIPVELVPPFEIVSKDLVMP